MNLFTIPLRTLRRKWVKNLLLALVFTVGVSAIVALWGVSRVVGASLEQKLTAFGANIVLQPKADRLAVGYGGLALGDMLYGLEYLDVARVEEAVAHIALRERISVVAPKMVTPVRASVPGGEAVALGLVGVRFERERRLKGYWDLTGAYPAAPDQVLLGSAAAARLAAAPGARLDLAGRTVTVSGVLAPTGGDDDNVAFGDLSLAQELAGQPGKANLVEVAALCAGCPIEDIVAQIGQALPGADIKALRHVVEQRMVSVRFVQRLALSVSLIILLTACAMVGASMLSSVNERTREIGLLRSLGFSRGDVFALFSFEALVLGLFSGVLGYAAGLGAAGPILSALRAEGAAPGFDAAALALTAAGVSLVSILSTLFPAWKASRVEPSEALTAL